MIRLGRISYVNMAPVFHRLTSDVEEITGVPTELNRMLLAGEIDIAPISSIAYARDAPRLRLLPRLCVSSEGAVDSIQLVTPLPLGRVRSVAVTPESATSVVLTKVLLPRAELVPLEAWPDADAKLLIGDAALQSAFEDPTPHHDLGRLWLERTGLPMVFAVWAAPEPAADGLLELQDALVASVRAARTDPETLRLLPRLCVSSEGAVESIQLISKTPLARIRSVAVTPESATSVVLTRVLFPDAEQVPLGEDAEATLLIGDAALRSAFEDPTPHHDLGRLWLERTGLPMVFAVWAAPEPTHPGLPELEDALVASLHAARAEPERLAFESAERYGYPAGFLARYFEKLRYRFGPRERAGLYTFLELAHDAGELDEVPELRFIAAAGAAV